MSSPYLSLRPLGVALDGNHAEGLLTGGPPRLDRRANAGSLRRSARQAGDLVNCGKDAPPRARGCRRHVHPHCGLRQTPRHLPRPLRQCVNFQGFPHMPGNDALLHACRLGARPRWRELLPMSADETGMEAVRGRASGSVQPYRHQASLRGSAAIASACCLGSGAICTGPSLSARRPTAQLGRIRAAVQRSVHRGRHPPSPAGWTSPWAAMRSGPATSCSSPLRAHLPAALRIRLRPRRDDPRP